MQAVNRKWYGDRLWYLLNLQPQELRQIFQDQTWENLKNKRKLYRKQIRERKESVPPMPADYTPSDTPDEIRGRLDGAPTKTENEVRKLLVDQSQEDRLVRSLKETIKQLNIDPSFVKGFRVNIGSHGGFIKDGNNEIEYTDQIPNQKVSLIIEPEKFKKKWEPIDHAPVAAITPIKVSANLRAKGQKLCVVIPDPQIGFRRFVDGSVDPFHDESALSIALQVIADLQPDKVVCLGDYLDLPMFGRFEQSEDYAHTAQLAIDYGYKLLAKIRASVPKAELVVLEGNHDRRLQNSINNSNMSAFGIRRAEDVTGWPVFSVPYLLNFDTLKVKYVEGYPAGKYWINDRLQCIHGHIVGPPGQTAAKVVKAETVSTVFGHIHRIETAYDTQNVYNGARSNLAHSPGCLCRIDGGVPSAKGSTGLDGRPIKSYENWQQGMCLVDYEDGDAPFSLHPIYINTFQGYKTTVNGKLYTPDLSVLE